MPTKHSRFLGGAFRRTFQTPVPKVPAIAWGPKSVYNTFFLKSCDYNLLLMTVTGMCSVAYQLSGDHWTHDPVTHPASGGDLQSGGRVHVLETEELSDHAAHCAPVKVPLRVPVVERQLRVPAQGRASERGTAARSVAGESRPPSHLAVELQTVPDVINTDSPGW